jgi:hypothetical protein
LRATLHDELMREAGFETDYSRELEERDARRRRRVLVFIGVCTYVAVAVPLTLLGIPHIGGLVSLLWLPVLVIPAWVERRVRDRLGWDEKGRRR